MKNSLLSVHYSTQLSAVLNKVLMQRMKSGLKPYDLKMKNREFWSSESKFFSKVALMPLLSYILDDITDQAYRFHNVLLLHELFNQYVSNWL